MARRFLFVESVGTTLPQQILNGAMTDMDLIIKSPKIDSLKGKIITEATLRIADSLGARIKVIKGDFLSTNVYLENESGHSLVYRYQGEDNSQDIRLNIISSLITSYLTRKPVD